jgi:hypothetical protein
MPLRLKYVRRLTPTSLGTEEAVRNYTVPGWLTWDTPAQPKGGFNLVRW